MSGYARTSKHAIGGARTSDDDGPRGAAPGEDNPRWPGAPERQFDDDGNVTNARATCSNCGPSTLGYRCSECGADLTGAGS